MKHRKRDLASKPLASGTPETSSSTRHRLGLAGGISAVALGIAALGFAYAGGEHPSAAHREAAAASASTASVATAKPDKGTVEQAAPKSVASTKSAAGETKVERLAFKQKALSPDDRVAQAIEQAKGAPPPREKVEALLASVKSASAGKASDEAAADISASLNAYAGREGNTAATENDRRALEAIREVDRSDDRASSPEETKKAADVPPASFPSENAFVAARTTEAVHMRARGDKNASVVTTLPAGASIKTDAGCKGWCPVVYQDRKGFVYEDYVRNGAQATASASASSADAAGTPSGNQEATTAGATPAPQADKQIGLLNKLDAALESRKQNIGAHR